ncbi:unnamed protein product [Oreochromis niloticus]|nr:unnamed protein product [Mustela putorius furo]
MLTSSRATPKQPGGTAAPPGAQSDSFHIEVRLSVFTCFPSQLINFLFPDCSSCQSPVRKDPISAVKVFPDLLSAIPTGLHVTVIFFCGVVTLFSSVATGFFFFNAFGRPYKTLQGPVGLYLWTFITCVSSCLVMILFVSEVKLSRLSERIANFNEGNFIFQTYTERYDRCFWLFFLIFLLQGLNALLVRLAGIQFPFQQNKEVELSGGAADLMY